MSKEVYVTQEGLCWQAIQEAAENAIVQVCAQIGEFDWLQPYQVIQQYEKRGSGFFIDEEGHFITNMHVIEHAKRVWIHIPALGQMPLFVDIVGVCPDRDIALLKVSPEAFERIQAVLGRILFLEFGDSENVQRTESVLVMGYPLGQYSLKATTGVVSGIEPSRGYSLIQMTAPVNPGSSGGALLNASGQVVGITVSIAPRSQNIGYAIPINELRIILVDLYTHRLVRKPFLGARLVNCSDEKSSILGIPRGSGLYVAKVFERSLLDVMGILEGDVLYSINGLVLDEYGEIMGEGARDKVPFYDIISRMCINDVMQLEIYRDGKRMQMSIPLQLHDPFAIRRRYPDYELIEYEMIAGMVVMELANNHFKYLLSVAPELAHFSISDFRLSPVLVVTTVLPGSYAYQVRSINPGDIITSINDIAVSTIADWRKALTQNLQTSFLTIRTNKNFLSVLSIEKIIAQEEQLSRAFTYPITESVKRLIDRYKK